MDLTWEIAGQLAWTGIATSTSYLLFAVAFSLVLKINRVWNFAQAGIMVFGYFAVHVALNRFGFAVAPAIALGIVVATGVALALEWVSFRVLRERNASVLTFFIFTIAFSQFAIYLAELFFGADPKTLFESIVWPVFLVGPIVVSYWDLQAIAITGTALLAFGAFFVFSKEGQFLLAVADNPELAQIYGININRAYATSMAISAVLVVAGMYLVGSRAPIYPSSPLDQFLIFAVVATLLAGIGNIFGAAIAAVGLGLLQTFSILVISSTWQILLVYMLIFVTIILFPTGVVFRRHSRKITRISTPDALATVGNDTPKAPNNMGSGK
jgi:branched-subunit amino acid ABC-type transport system permease component